MDPSLLNIADGVDQLLTPFPEYTYDEARAEQDLILAKQPRTRRGLPYVLPYLFRGGSETILVDPGWHTGEAYEALETEMRAVGSHPSEITRVLVTHAHGDHYGMAGQLRAIAGCEVIMHRADGPAAGRDLNSSDWSNTFQAFMEHHGVPAATSSVDGPGGRDPARDAPPFEPDTLVEGGEIFRAGPLEIEVVWTPGHTPGHICFYERTNRLLATGDHVLPTITPNVSLFNESGGEPLADYVRSLDLLRTYTVDRVLPAHEYSHPGLEWRLDEIEAHHVARLAEIRGCVDPGGSTAWDVAQRATWARGKLTGFTPRLQRSAVGETIAHLEYLFRDGQVSKTVRDDTLYWFPNE